MNEPTLDSTNRGEIYVATESFCGQTSLIKKRSIVMVARRETKILGALYFKSPIIASRNPACEFQSTLCI